ncbi:MAG: replication-associated recombination protein A [Deltaproteobacteria bacterium]|nr:replication-associated recombination protein A [Deltaproteobacteria bacterium]
MPAQDDLFRAQAEREQRHAPLAERMRPRALDELVGQERILGPGRLLRRAIEGDRLPSMVLWGPPGCGKTALAAVIARSTGAEFVPFSAVMQGVRDIRQIAAEAGKRRDLHARRTVLFIDEIHRLNKAQQDALLPHVERGTFVLIGATTENPSFEVNAALLSRTRVFTLEPLETEALAAIVRRALADPQRGLGRAGIAIDDDALDALCRSAAGDARRALNVLEAAAQLAELEEPRLERISARLVDEAVQHRSLLYDKAGEEHYNVISAFIKSLRGSDPDAAVYWMTRMLEAGEDPRFILRRMVIFASEDVGNADPHALPLAVAALQAHELVGLPESALCLSQAACYLACAPKSNSALCAYTRARKDVLESGALPAPLKLRNAPTGLMRSLGYGRDYRYPHNFEGHYAAEHYLPEALRGRCYYTPSESGLEREIGERLAAWRAQRDGADEDGSREEPE